jgi:hypothetical protein
MATKRKAIKPKPKNAGVDLALPASPKNIDPDLGNYITLIYGREKIGKSTLAASYPKALFLATEPGLRGLSVHSMNDDEGGITDWGIFRTATELLLKQGPGQFNTIIVDTADRAYDMCLDWVCANRGVEYPGTDAQGKEDFGKSWRAVKNEFLEQIHALIQAGYGMVFTSHAKEVTIVSRSGEKYDRIYPSMSAQARTVIEALVDFFFYAEYVKDLNGNQCRVLICEGDETIWAGARETPGGSMPRFLPLQKKGGYEIIQRAFNGDDVGLDPTTLIPSKASTKTGGEFLKKNRLKAKGGSPKTGRKIIKKR